MKPAKPTLEKVSPSFGRSILVRNHTNVNPNNKASWHFHPEVELVYIDSGRGKRHIGNHLSYFQNSMLVLIGSNLPHHGFSDRLTNEGTETLIQFLPAIFGNSFLSIPEMEAIKQLLDRAKKGILFGRATKDNLGPRIQHLAKLEGIYQVLELVAILNELSMAQDYDLLNADGYALETTPQDSQRVNRIFAYVDDHFTRTISLDEIADEVSMTVPAFCRYIKKVTGKTFTKLVNEYRIVHATKLLAESNMSIADICYECGFNNFSHFNKLFNEFTGRSASSYRKEMKFLIKK